MLPSWFRDQDPERPFSDREESSGELAVSASHVLPCRQAPRIELEAWLDMLIRQRFAASDPALLTTRRQASTLRRTLCRPTLEIREGEGPDCSDAQIAAVAKVHDMAVATRNVADFEHLGVAVINPWEAG